MSEHGASIREWIRRHPMAFHILDTSAKTGAPVDIVERATGKTLRIALEAITHLEQDRDPVRGGSYLRVGLEDGRHFVLSGLGFVFAPSFVSTGELPECPPVASFLDFEKIFGHLSHLVDDQHEGREGEALQTMMILISFLDGARAIELDVSSEEQRLETKLKVLEGQGVVPS